MREERVLSAIVMVRVGTGGVALDVDDAFELGDDVGVVFGVCSMRDRTASRQSDV